MADSLLTPLRAPAIPAPRSPWPWALAAALILLGLGLRLAIGGLPVQTEYPFATCILLDGGARILDHQIPYRDFHTPIGFTYLALVGGFLSLAHGLPHALALLSASAGVAIGAWTWWLAIGRCAPPLAASAAVLVGLLAASPALFGFGPLDVSYGGHYSRLAWSLLGAVVIQAGFAPRRPAGPWRASGEAIGLGIALGLLFGIKFTFLFAALAVVTVGWLFHRPDRRSVIGLSCGALLAVGIGLWASGASIGGYLRDCASVGGTVSMTGLLTEYRRKLDLLSLALLSAIVLWTWPVHWRSWRMLPMAPLMATLVLALGIGLSASTGIEDASPCYLLAGLLLTGGVPRTPVEAIALRGAALVVGALLWAFSARLAMPIIKGPYASSSAFATLDDGPWRGLDFMPGVKGAASVDGLVPYVWIQPRNVVDNAWFLYLQEGQALLRGKVAPEQRVMSLDYMNPFSYLLGRRPPRGDHLFWTFDRNVTRGNAPGPEALFAEADWVMVPEKELFNRSAKDKKDLYLGWVADHYEVDGRNAWWTCYRRRP